MNVLRSHRRNQMLVSCSVLAAMGTLSPKAAQAYDNDTHFDLTYYIARAAGYTPEQAWRIASADLAVDTSVQTEPEQLVLRFKHGPKVRQDFHAFRSLSWYPSGAAADAAIQQALHFRYNEAYQQQNPGVYLHAYQDSYAHAGYWCGIGHWNWLGTIVGNTGHSPNSFSLADFRTARIW